MNPSEMTNEQLADVLMSEKDYITDHDAECFKEAARRLRAAATVQEGLSFKQLAAANDERAKQWNPSGASVPLSFSLLELAGEAGEACNIGKKLARTELGLAGGATDQQPLIDEIADVVICADLVARKMEFDLGAAVVAKFNQTSVKRGFTVMLAAAEAASKAVENG